MVVVLLLSGFCEDEALSRTQQARYAVVDVLVITSLLWVIGNAYGRDVSYQVQYRKWWHVICGMRYE